MLNNFINYPLVTGSYHPNAIVVIHPIPINSFKVIPAWTLQLQVFLGTVSFRNATGVEIGAKPVVTVT